MKFQLGSFRWALWPTRIRGMFNLNDPRWGRGDDKPVEGEKADPAPTNTDSPDAQPKSARERGQKRGPNQGPPDLDELWRDFNRKLTGLFGGLKKGGGGGGGGSGGGFQPDMKSAGIGVGSPITCI